MNAKIEVSTVLQRIGMALVAMGLAGLLAACGGGGGSDAPAPVSPPATAITAQPTDQSAVVGTSATFSVTATNTTGYQWQRSSDGGATFVDVAGATSASHTTAATTPADNAAQYRVVVAGSANSVTSSAVTLTVTAAAVAPSITVQPASITVTAGQNASFSVTATGTALNYQWQLSTDSGASYDDVAGAAAATFTLNAVSVTDDGFLRVIVSNALGSVTSARVMLTINPAPVAATITQQPVSQSVTAPAAATFIAAVSGTPAPTLQWQVNVAGSWSDIIGATGPSYTTPATAVGDNGKQYRVTASNAAGNVSSNLATLTVSAAPVIASFTLQPTSVAITEGQNTSFTVAASGTPTPDLQWQFSTDNGASWSSINGATSAVFNVINAAQANNGRQFRAVASNSVGSVPSNAATLTVSPRSWSTATAIEINNTGDAFNPQIAVNAAGNTVAVWQQDGDAGPGVREDIWANHYTAQGWGTAVLIEGAAGNAINPQVAMDANGNALAVWQQAGATGDSIWSNRYTAGAGWGTPVMIQANSEFAQSVQIAMDANGNALAAWVQINTGYRIWANRYTNGAGWGTAALIETNTTADRAEAPDIAFDASGNAMAVWAQSNATVASIWANRYIAGTGWDTATLIEAGAGDAFGAQVVLDGSGNALAVWTQTNGTVYSVWANRYSAGAWGSAALIESDNAGSANAPQIAMDLFGNATAVWSQSNGTLNNIWANRFSANAWGTAVLIETNNGSFADNPKITADANGNVLAVWKQFRPITYNRYTLSAGWGAAALVDSNPNNESTSGPQIATDGTGNGFAVWVQFDGTRNNIMASSFR